MDRSQNTNYKVTEDMTLQINYMEITCLQAEPRGLWTEEIRSLESKKKEKGRGYTKTHHSATRKK